VIGAVDIGGTKHGFGITGLVKGRGSLAARLK